MTSPLEGGTPDLESKSLITSRVRRQMANVQGAKNFIVVTGFYR